MTLRSVLLATMLIITVAGQPARGAEESPSIEHKVKAAYLFNFAGYVEWPAASFASPQAPIRIGVIGSDAIAQELTRTAAGRTVHGRTIAVQRMTTAESMAGVHIIFIAAESSANIPEIAQAALPHSVLIVTESSQSLTRGSMINFVVIDRRVRFEIALDSADKSNLRLSSRLLAVAQHVRTGTP